MTVTLDLPPNVEEAYRAEAQAKGMPFDALVREVLIERQAAPELAAKPEEQSRDARPIWEVMLDNVKDITPAEFAILPRDGASEVDRCLYGHPKRSQSPRFSPKRFTGSRLPTFRTWPMNGPRHSRARRLRT